MHSSTLTHTCTETHVLIFTFTHLYTYSYMQAYTNTSSHLHKHMPTQPHIHIYTPLPNTLSHFYTSHQSTPILTPVPTPLCVLTSPPLSVPCILAHSYTFVHICTIANKSYPLVAKCMRKIIISLKGYQQFAVLAVFTQ